MRRIALFMLVVCIGCKEPIYVQPVREMVVELRATARKLDIEPDFMELAQVKQNLKDRLSRIPPETLEEIISEMESAVMKNLQLAIDIGAAAAKVKDYGGSLSTVETRELNEGFKTISTFLNQSCDAIEKSLKE